MAKKLTPQEKEKRDIEKIVKKIEAIESRYKNKDYVRMACSRFATTRREENRLKKKIKEAEKELEGMKKDLR